MRCALLLTLCAIMSLLAQTATAQTPQVQATFHAASASWEEAEPIVSGDLLGLVLRRPLNEGDAPAANHWFNLTASSIHVEWDASEIYGETPAGFFSPFPAVTHGAADHSNAAIVGHHSRDDRFAYLFPLDGASLQVSLPCGTATQSDFRLLEAESKVDTARPPPGRDTTSALQFEPCQNSQLTVSGGPFLVVLWEWDADLISDQGQELLWSGKAPGNFPMDARPYASRARQLYLTVDIGSFTMRSEPGWEPSVFTSDATLSHAAHVTLTQARGTFTDVGDVVTADRLRFVGDMDLRLAPDGDALLAKVGGAREASVDGSIVPLTTTTTRPTSPIGLWLTFAMVGAVLVPVPVVLVRRRMFEARLDRYISQAYELQNRMLYGRSLALTHRLLAHDTTNADIHFLHGCGLLLTSRPAKALFHLERSLELAKRGLKDPAFCAEVCIEAARAAAAQCTSDADLHWNLVLEYLRQAIKLDPTCKEGVSRQPDLIPFLPGLAILLAGHNDPNGFFKP